MTNGIVTVYKEKGWTSHDVVARLRRIFGQKKAGHTGTLDPEAEGVLPVCLGPSTRVCALLTDLDKTYEADMLLGLRTDTQDLTGRVLERSTDLPDPEEVRAAVSSFTGLYSQIPPMYSALKVNGRKLYEMARAGEEVERKPRNVQIFSIEIPEMNLPHCRLRVSCSKGTYIRTLCDDIGRKLGCGAVMASLLRTGVGMFSLQDAVRISQLEEAAENDALEQFVCPPDRLFPTLPEVRFAQSAGKAARNGNPLPYEALCGIPYPEEVRQVRMYDPQGLFYGIYVTDPQRRQCRPVRILTDLSQT